MRRALGLWVTAVTILFQASAVYAEPTNGEVMDMLQKMQKQMAEMQRTIELQNMKIQQLESGRNLEIPVSAQPSTPGATMSDADFQKSLKDNVNEVIPWMKGLKFGGDLRLRMENFDYFDENASTGANDRSRNRFRFRLRYGFEKDYGDDFKIGFRMATATPSTTSGVATDNAGTNVTLGNPGYFTYKNIYLDRAYAQYSPNGLKDYGPVKGVTIGAGKFDNPFLRYSTPIVWDGDVTPEGAYEKVMLQLLNTEENKLDFHGTAGQFLVNENAGYRTDAGLLAHQGALHWSTYAFSDDKPTDFHLAVSHYDYTNFDETITSNTTGVSLLRTNTAAIEHPRIVDIYPEIGFNVGKWPITLWGNYVENNGSFNPSVVGNNEAHSDDTAHGYGIKIGKTKEKGDWEFFAGVYEIGANAVVAAFNDSDFGGPGGVGHTNREGYKFGLGYQLTKNVLINWTGILVQPLRPVGTAVAANALDENVFRSQLDASFKF